MKNIQRSHTILYVEDQELSTGFYTQILRQNPFLHVAGMTEFQVTENFTLGLMPNSGIAKILGDKTLPPASGTGIPRCELYLYVEDIEVEVKNIVEHKIELISAVQERNWGDTAFYFADPDGHIIAFATKTQKNS